MSKFLVKFKDYLEDLDAEVLHYYIDGIKFRLMLHPDRHDHFEAFIEGWREEKFK